jgi:uncharacterized protein (DUF2384 family)
MMPGKSATVLSMPADEVPPKIRKYGLAIFGSRAALEKWLQQPNAGFGGERPRELLRTTDGIRRVEAVLGRRLFGGYD